METPLSSRHPRVHNKHSVTMYNLYRENNIVAEHVIYMIYPSVSYSVLEIRIRNWSAVL